MKLRNHGILQQRTLASLLSSASTTTDMHSQPRSFAKTTTASFPETNKDGTPTSFAAPWGREKNIWAVDAFVNTGTKPDLVKPRDYGHPSVDKKSGSGMLLEGSQVWSTRIDTGNRASPLTRQVEGNGPQLRHGGNAGSQQACLTPTENISPTTTRPPMINLTNSDFATRMARNGFSSHESGPPTLYTKFNAPAPAVDSRTDSISPVETRKNIWSTTPRDHSLPSSRHSNTEPTFPAPPANSQFTPANTRTHSYSAQRSPAYNTFQSGFDQMLPQFGQMNLGQNGHAAALRKASEPWTEQNGQRTVQHATRYNSLPTNEREDIEEIDPLGMGFVASNDYAPVQHIDYSSRFSNARFGQTPVQHEFRPANDFTNGGASPRENGFPAGIKYRDDWSSYMGDPAFTAQLMSMSEQQQHLLDPRVQHQMHQQMQQQMLAMKNSYQGAIFNPYALQNAMQSNGSAAYIPMYPMGVPGLDNNMTHRESLISDGVQSTKLYDFKNAGKNNKRWELSDIFDHIAEFAGDQYGSRFIQTKLETANSDEKERVFREIEPNAIPLMTDVFGNYVIQKFFDHGHQEHKKLLASKMRGQVLNLSLQMYGCRVVQKALEHILVEQQTALVCELENHVMKCIKDQNGNHVIQKAIERCNPDSIKFIYAAFLGEVQHLSLHPYGCRVIQRCLERPEHFEAKPSILTELHDSMQRGMIADQYGNYVVQHVVQKGSPRDKIRVFRIVIVGLEGYSKHKYASNVVEKCIEYSDDGWRREVVNTLTAGDRLRSEGDSTLVSMIKDNFGNYVIREFSCYRPLEQLLIILSRKTA
jgi:hypothetical protein